MIKPSKHYCRWLIPLWLSVLAGCWSAPDRQVVVYTALDREFSEPILQDFEQRTGIRVLAKYDVESTKTVGWSTRSSRNAIGLVAICSGTTRSCTRCGSSGWACWTVTNRRGQRISPLKRSVARWSLARFRGADPRPAGQHGLVPEDKRPDSILDLVDPQWQGRVGVAKPLFGMTATHAAVLFDTWGDERARDFFQQLRANAQILAGNKQVALAVSSGQIAIGWTDTDDAIIEQDKGMPVEIVYPDQGEGQMGALFIPNTLALIQGSAHGEEARQLVDFLLSPEVEVASCVGRQCSVSAEPPG
jgi:iron(III) transport system substrate-binding protein